MGFFSRLATVIKSNLNDLISSAEDPEKMLDQILVEMREQLIEAKKQLAVAIADEKKLERQHKSTADEAQSWEKKAMLAVRAGDDNLAKEALRRQKEIAGLAEQSKEQWQRQAHSVAQLKDALRALNNKIEEAGRKKGVLIARKRRAEAMKSIQNTMSGLNDQSAFEAFDRMEQKITQAEAEADAATEMNQEFQGDMLKQKFEALEGDAGADEALAELKRKMGLSAPEPTAAVAARVEAADEAETGEMAELEAALEELKVREGKL
ncbi:MAG: PspA/IM30 family protein [Myxococcales bacterium]|nr:PspA/IM30 family protein [Myxococcales bacterium]